MRASGGTVRRTNCISPTPFRSDDFTSVLAAGEALYHRLGRPTIVKILSIGDDVDEMLADRGYTIDAPSQVLWAPTSRVGPDPKQWQSRREPCLRIGSRLGWRSVAHPGWQLSECVLVSHNLACRLCIVSAEGRDRCLGVRHHPSRHSRYRRRRDNLMRGDEGWRGRLCRAFRIGRIRTRRRPPVCRSWPTTRPHMPSTVEQDLSAISTTTLSPKGLSHASNGS